MMAVETESLQATTNKLLISGASDSQYQCTAGTKKYIFRKSVGIVESRTFVQPTLHWNQQVWKRWKLS